MQSLVWLLLLLPADGKGPPAGAAAAAQIAQAYRKLDAPAQRAWLARLLIDRTQPAARHVLAADAFARLASRHAAILVAADQGRRLSPAGIERLLSELQQYELAALEALSRQFRMATYDQFRTDRRRYDARLATWRQLEAHWRSAGSRVDARRQLLDWLQAAIRQTVAHSNLPLPPSPLQVDQRPAAPEPTPAARPQPTAPSPAPPAVERSPAPAPPGGADALEPLVAVRPAPPAPAPAAVPTQAPATVVKDSDAALFEHFQINVDELAARIAGHNLALHRLTDTARGGDGWGIDELRAAVERLEDLAAKAEDAQVYLKLLDERQRAGCGTLDPRGEAITALAARIAALRARSTLSAPADAGRSAAGLDGLSRRLARLAVERPR